jgi:hypothetical protein
MRNSGVSTKIRPSTWSLLTAALLAVLVVVGVAACFAQDSSSGPAIALSPSSAGPNTQVLITGQGFPPETVLNLRLGPPDVGATPQSYGQVVTDENGGFTLSFFVPGQWPDRTPVTEKELIIVILNEDGSIKATAPFEFEPIENPTPELSLQPGNGVPGQQIEVIGQFFSARRRIVLRLGVPDTGLSGADLATAEVDARGTFNSLVTLPESWPGSYSPISEPQLLIAAVDPELGRTLATAPFLNQAGVTALAPPVKAYANVEGNFSLLLPEDWEVLGPTPTELGSQYMLGPAPLAAQTGPQVSSLQIARATDLSMAQALALLCGGCTPLPQLQDAVLNGLDAKLAHVDGEGSPALEWIFVRQEDKLIYFSIHDPDTLVALDGIAQTYTPGPELGGPAALAAAQLARQRLAVDLGVNPFTLVIASAEKQNWRDACLELPREGEACAQVVTPGYYGTLQSRETQYEYRVDAAGTTVRWIPGAVLNARQLLAAQLGVGANEIKTVRVERVDWPDACLGVSTRGLSCAAGVTPGYKVILQVQDRRYELHTDEQGAEIRLAAAAAPDLPDVAMTWTKDGGGPCRTATFGLGALAFGVCGGPLMVGRYVLPERAATFQFFLSAYAPFQAETAAGQLRFGGHGRREATPAEQRMIAEWAQLAVQETAAGRSGASYGLALAWHREGGVAGFCDDLAVYVTGEFFASSCRGEQPKELARGRLTPEQLLKLYDWIDGLSGFELEEPVPASADNLTVRVVFSGAGPKAATPAEQQAILELHTELFTPIDD